MCAIYIDFREPIRELFELKAILKGHFPTPLQQTGTPTARSRFFHPYPERLQGWGIQQLIALLPLL